MGIGKGSLNEIKLSKFTTGKFVWPGNLTMKSGIVEFFGHLGKPGDWSKSDKDHKMRDCLQAYFWHSYNHTRLGLSWLKLKLS